MCGISLCTCGALDSRSRGRSTAALGAVQHRSMFFADLTPYEYGYEMPRGHILNVGWLSRGHAFPVGAVPEGFVNALRRLVKSPENLYRGYHSCEFCPDPPLVVSSTGRRVISPPGDT